MSPFLIEYLFCFLVIKNLFEILTNFSVEIIAFFMISQNEKQLHPMIVYFSTNYFLEWQLLMSLSL